MFCVQMTSLEFGPLLGKVRVSVQMNPVLKQICRQWWISWYIFFFLCLAPCWEVKEKVFLWRAWMEGLKQKRNQQNGRWAAASWSRCRHNSSSEQKPSQTEPAEMFEYGLIKLLFYKHDLTGLFDILPWLCLTKQNLDLTHPTTLWLWWPLPLLGFVLMALVMSRTPDLILPSIISII